MGRVRKWPFGFSQRKRVANEEKRDLTKDERRRKHWYDRRGVHPGFWAKSGEGVTALGAGRNLGQPSVIELQARPGETEVMVMDWKEHGVKIVHAGELDMNTPQTPGMSRAAAITHARTGANKLWAGKMVVQPDAKTGPHHHGELETVLYIVRGRVRMRWGDQLELSGEAEPGDFIYVPPYVPHQEINASPNEICEAVVVRNGQEPIVVNLDVETPEPASAGHPGMPFHPDS